MWTKSIVLAFVFAISSTVLPAFERSIISAATGLGAAREIASNIEYQDEIDLAPEQLQAIKSLLESPELSAKLLEIRRKERSNPDRNASLREKELRESEQIDQFVIPKLQQILAPEQIRMRRILYLRREYGRRRNALSAQLFCEFHISGEELEAIEVAAGKANKANKADDATLNHVIAQKCSEVLAESPTETLQKFEHLFGNGFLPNFVKPTPFNVDRIMFLSGAREYSQLVKSRYFNFPKALALSAQQSTRIESLVSEVHRTIASSPNADLNKLAGGVRDILSEAQRAHFVQQEQAGYLRWKLASVFECPEVIQYLNLTEEQLQSIRPIAQEAEREITKEREAADSRIFESVLRAMQPDTRKAFSDFLEGV